VLQVFSCLKPNLQNVPTEMRVGQFLVRDVIHTSHAYATMSVSICLSVTFVHCGHRMQWIPDIFACLDRWISLLLTDNASPGSSDGMMPGFLVEDCRGMEKLVIVAISLNLLTESLLDGWTGNSNDDFVYIFIIVGAEEFSLVISVENALYLKNGLC